MRIYKKKMVMQNTINRSCSNSLYFIVISSLLKLVQRHHILLSNMMGYYNNSAVKNQFHIGSFRGYSAIMDNK